MLKITIFAMKKKKNATIKNDMKTMNILRMTLVFALLWCAGLQNAKAGSLLSKEDSLELVKMYQDYLDAKKQVEEIQRKRSSRLNYNDSLYNLQYKELDNLYQKEIDELKRKYENALATNPRYEQLARLRSLLLKYDADRTAAYAIMQKEREEYSKKNSDLQYYEVSQLFDNPFRSNWDKKLIQLILDHPLFIEYPEYLFKEINEGNHVVTSTDGRLRYYNWFLSYTYSSEPDIVFKQYRTDEGKILVSLDGDDSKNRINHIHMLEANGKMIYLLEKENEDYRDWDLSNVGLYAEAIEGQTITHPQIFDTADNNGNLVVKYRGKVDWVIKYDEATRTIIVRNYKDENNDVLSDDYTAYTFDGKKFVHSSYEYVDYATNRIISYVEEGVFFEDQKTLFDKPLEILTGYFNDEKFVLSDKTLVEDMKRRIERKEPIAHVLYLGAAERGDAVAQYKLGKCYYNGYMGVKRNTEEAKKWFEMAANQGHWLSQQHLGTYYNYQRYNQASSWHDKNLAEMQVLTEELNEFVSDRDKAKEAWGTVMEHTFTDDLNFDNVVYDHYFQRIWEEKFIDFIREHPKTLDCSGKEMEKLLGKDFDVVTSPDGILRTYNWCTNRGGTMANRCQFSQFRTADGKTYITWRYDGDSQEDSDDNTEDSNNMDESIEEDEYATGLDKYEMEQEWEWSTTTEKIVQMDTGNGRIYILQDYLSQNGIYGVKYLKACVITDGSVFLIPIFIIEDNKKTSSISFEGQNAWLLDKDFITFDEANRTITIKQYDEGETDEDGNYKRLDDIVYRFDGQFFRQVK